MVNSVYSIYKSHQIHAKGLTSDRGTVIILKNVFCSYEEVHGKIFRDEGS
jgi:hypothetical protein